MDRRTFVGALAAVLTAGCASSGGTGTDTEREQPSTESSATESPTTRTTRAPGDVSVTYTRSSGWVGWSETVSIDESGTVTYTEECSNLDQQRTTTTASPAPRTREATLSEDEYQRLQRLVTDADPETWQRDYGCEGPCPTDMPVTRLTVTVDGQTYETGYTLRPGLPDRIDAIVDVLQEQRDTFESPC